MPHPPPHPPTHTHSPCEKGKRDGGLQRNGKFVLLCFVSMLARRNGCFLSHFVHDVYSAQFVWDRMMDKKMVMVIVL